MTRGEKILLAALLAETPIAIVIALVVWWAVFKPASC